ncbi:hypothetical protein RFI_37683 [Reticulomyxa filosa]|uniref:Uncharacterized protein n=1 Tax=Reticulomyxa filosa TaxID=46433 RepID=X6LE04_RETFI|nr:hypothetical protein RFI_37683 [Reticulomyxa filosa]|eukprot:ETN99783.1 hypothetical protein RFI_37683 [Reticulomyxa filosa]
MRQPQNYSLFVVGSVTYKVFLNRRVAAVNEKTNNINYVKKKKKTVCCLFKKTKQNNFFKLKKNLKKKKDIRVCYINAKLINIYKKEANLQFFECFHIFDKKNLNKIIVQILYFISFFICDFKNSMELASQGFLLQYTPLQNCNSYQKRKNRVNETQDTQNNNTIQKKGAVITAQKILLFIVISPDIGNIQVDVVYLHVKRGYQFFCCLFRKSDIRSYTLFKVKNKFYNTTISSSTEIDVKRHYKPAPSIFSNKFVNKVTLNQIAKGYPTTHNH